MNAARRVVALEVSTGAAFAAYGLWVVGVAGLQETWWVAAAAAVAVVATVSVAEHRLNATGGARYALAILGVVGATVAAGVVVALTALSVDAVVGAALVGTGVGVCGYRVVYGLCRPVPETRLERTREREL